MQYKSAMQGCWEMFLSRVYKIYMDIAEKN
ncbi:hypothetical protein NIASO_10140 [Niabella soli DSM 19437]|uniref:Uncharacterized protein n=1 Tax=Niabella soli DSM 19437 TaxID=929713 RepID=W0F868_9BACT|nr:hypothetical protein NIASO_10140 [Niabella soli DSM 19437]